MNIKFFLKKNILIFFFLSSFIFSKLALCENNTNLKCNLNSELNLNLAPMLKDIMPSIVRIISISYNNIEYHNYDTFSQNKTNNFININKNISTKKYFLDKNKLLKKNIKYTINNTENNKLGSGVIIDSENSYVLTNYHVISKSSAINVYLTNGKLYHAVIVGKSIKMDLALLKLCNAKNLQSIKIADYKTVNVGDYAISIGSPYNLKNSVSFGVVSGLKRVNHELNLYDDFIQTDAAINHGNSGGPLVNTKGELIGINTSIISNSEDDGNIGIGFSIPTNTILRFIEQIKKNGEYHQGELGILGTQINKTVIHELKLSVHGGILVNLVQEDSAAQNSQIYPGDIITSIDNQSFYNMFYFRSILKNFVEDDTISLTIFRNGKYINKEVKLKYHVVSRRHAGLLHYKLAGAIVDTYNSQEENEKCSQNCSECCDNNDVIYSNLNGIIIKNVKENSFAERSGLLKNDIIISVNNIEVNDIESFKKALSIYKNIIILEISRQNYKFFKIIS
ncbi:trypsin-like peptidase domain-containing protein [Buchnera aphidicola]|uniref:trypsin-like peptidase domain-containing protein n=1 Tax=Buchnera aphidicola TaxID=9 RepID=UPI002237A404|nr:trypsin-like peptidase domain-containing protein [Buchnera aphidicola]MCW5197758.1 trypsin-like peptidase domain-containing protein [Buchnera aphidicola (Chaitophorus viminalis)]